jgi:hypothetical protein
VVDGRFGRARWEEVKSGWALRSDEEGTVGGGVVVVVLLLEVVRKSVEGELERAFCFGTHCRGSRRP